MCKEAIKLEYYVYIFDFINPRFQSKQLQTAFQVYIIDMQVLNKRFINIQHINTTVETDFVVLICLQMNPKPTVFEILNFFELNVARFLSTVEPQPMITNDLNELGLWGEYGACRKQYIVVLSLLVTDLYFSSW